MIEPTDEMYEALFDAGDACGGEFASKEDVLRGLAAVLALVERDYDVTPKLPPFEHRMVGDGPRWSHYMNAYTVECTCGATYGGEYIGARDQLLDHIDANTATPPQ
ncbi:hypothetical protein GCM10010112_67660 [Actinoplanes lobatus]|uniref:Uncharacterized protein n=1 Tax=Actinoplanes lobatus TaxID=113568 RepID=A0A7W7HEQ5_9ACTN|nr:hypothetical protein [Actinoplanes lobatus]MBB4749154.1 hypothetical protein [Actinoplanes lobatus]GGN86295.1 hypothetical protein GCM10010112_67660 [Actinoplanes lobatus]GIE42748.1 hypothetical protein Alo02nite_56460 [Actinoplanes lobatus]